jgi:hypothetical protein
VSLRLGVVGHRRYDDPEGALVAIDAVIERVLTGEAPTVVSSLAEGADRVVAHRVMARAGARLEAVLPLPAPDYRRDFATAASCAEFDELLGRAVEVQVVRAPASATREQCYELAAHAVVEGCDVLLAVWDGQPGRGRGGTAESVRYALDRDVPVEMIMVSRETT